MTLKDVMYQEIGIYFCDTPEGRNWIADYFMNYLLKEICLSDEPLSVQITNTNHNYIKTANGIRISTWPATPTGMRGHRFHKIIIQKGISKEFVNTTIIPHLWRHRECDVFEIDPKTNEIDLYFK